MLEVTAESAGGADFAGADGVLREGVLGFEKLPLRVPLPLRALALLTQSVKFSRIRRIVLAVNRDVDLMIMSGEECEWVNIAEIDQSPLKAHKNGELLDEFRTTE